MLRCELASAVLRFLKDSAHRHNADHQFIHPRNKAARCHKAVKATQNTAAVAPPTVAPSRHPGRPAAVLEDESMIDVFVTATIYPRTYTSAAPRT